MYESLVVVGKIRRDKKLTPIFPKSSEHFFFPLHNFDLFVWLYETFVIAIASSVE
jgi:hypothetical protein